MNLSQRIPNRPEVKRESGNRSLAGDRIHAFKNLGLEAANGTELFGFERTHEISTKPAGEIAVAAKTWRQNDDITVSVKFANAGHLPPYAAAGRES